MTDPKSVSAIRERFSKQGIDSLQESASQQVAAILEHEAPRQPVVDKNGWDGDLYNLEDISKAFSREELEADFLKAIDLEAPGVSGDLISISVQGDWLATQERAFRSRHQTPIRAWLHALARRKGQAHDAGVIRRGLLGYVENLLQASKNTEATT